MRKKLVYFFLLFISIFSEEAILRYQGREGNFLLFYDRENTPFALYFKKDKWDYRYNSLEKELIPGVLYQVEYLPRGWIFLPLEKEKPIYLPYYEEKISSPDDRGAHLGVLKKVEIYWESKEVFP